MRYSVKPISREEAVRLSNEWLKEWNLNPIDEGMHSEHPLALYNENNKLMYIGYVWLSDSEMAMIGFISRNKKVKSEIPNVRKLFIQELVGYAKLLGYKYVATWAQDTGLKSDFRELGFTETSNKVSEFFAHIN